MDMCDFPLVSTSHVKELVINFHDSAMATLAYVRPVLRYTDVAGKVTVFDAVTSLS